MVAMGKLGWEARSGLLLILLLLMPLTPYAIDNPDAPDLVGEFLARSAPYEAAAGRASGGREIVLAYHAYLTFLDAELNRAYRVLMSKLGLQQQLALRNSQRGWLAFRDAEFQFIDANWSRDRFGSSALVSAEDYRCSLVRERVIQLLHYAKNYR
jgi:uncharacterized protein YecT (DUF1311 family)